MDFSKAKILCLGDIMLDKFAYCDTERISPEAPVPVLLLKQTQSMLGGAGNVARNIASLGGQAVLLGLLGTDEAGAEIRALVSGGTSLVGQYTSAVMGVDGLPFIVYHDATGLDLEAAHCASPLCVDYVKSR